MRTTPGEVALGRIRCVGAAGQPLRLPEVSEARVLRRTRHVLGQSVLCSIATVTRRHRAHVATAYFAFSDALELFFLSHPGSLHCRNLKDNPSLAVAVFSSDQRWTEPDVGLQLFGHCRQAAGRHLETAERVYGHRFPSYEAWKKAAASETVVRDYRLYRCLISRLKIHDEREFGDGVFVAATIQRRRQGASQRRPQ